MSFIGSDIDLAAQQSPLLQVVRHYQFAASIFISPLGKPR
jgi:hypothetical protein